MLGIYGSSCLFSSRFPSNQFLLLFACDRKSFIKSLSSNQTQIIVILLLSDLIQSLPEIAARAKCEKLRVVKTVAVGNPLARFSRE